MALSLGSIAGLAITAAVTINASMVSHMTTLQSQDSDDRGSGRISADLTVPGSVSSMLAIRGSGRIGNGNESETSSNSSATFADILMAYRGSGRVDSDPQFSLVPSGV